MLENLDQMMLEDQLAHHRVRIDFNKVDGTSRNMLCTKNPEIITEDNMPSAHPISADGVPSAPPTVLKVFDLEKQAWRSMRIANITAWQLEQ
jgi:hypothetical protein